MKERIIGAVVLVVFVVLVVPIFLDGPPPEGEIVTETVVLPGQSEQKMQTQVLNRDRETPVPEPAAVASSGDASAQDAPSAKPRSDEAPVGRDSSEPEPRPAEPKPEPEPITAAAERGPENVPAAQHDPALDSATGMWAVQLGAFSDKAKAEKLAADLRKQGFFAVLSRLDTDEGQLHRVRIGPQADRAAAEAVVKKLAAAGHKGQVVPHP